MVMAKKIVSGGGSGSHTTAVEISIKEFLESIPQRIDSIEAQKLGYFSARMFADRAGYSYVRAREILARECKQKKLESISVKESSGNTAKYYRPIKKK